MQVIYYNHKADLYVVQGDDHSVPPVLLAGFTQFDNDSAFNQADPVMSALANLAAEHCLTHTNFYTGFTYAARRDGVTISFAQWLRTDKHAFGNEYLIEALDAVTKYLEAAK